MASLSEGVRRFLERDDWPLAETSAGEATVFETVFAGADVAWAVRVSAYDAYGQVIVESLVPLDSAAHYRVDLERLLLEVNWQLLTGAFLLDPGTGEVRFRNGLLLPDGELVTDRLVKGLLYSNVLTVERCWRGLLAVADGALDAPAALARLAL